MGAQENEIKFAILSYLKLIHIYAWSNNSGAVSMKSPNGSNRFVRYGKPGSADILGVMSDGRFLAIECKTKTGKLTEMQRDFLEDIRYRGGVAFVARSVEDVEREIKAAMVAREEAS